MYAIDTGFEPPPLAGSESSWLDEPVQLRPGVTRLSGANGEPLLYLPATRGYLRLSRSGAAIVSLLDGSATGTDVIARLAARQPGGSRAPVDRLVIGFLEELRKAEALTVPADCPPRRRRLARFARSRRYFPLLSTVEPVVRLPAAVLWRFPRAVVAAVAGMATSALVVMAAALTKAPPHGSIVWPAVPFVIVCEVVIHELAHATVCDALDTPVREAGVALWCWVVPIAYVDCTDAYRLAQRSRRVGIALAGPAVDILAAGVAAVVSLAGSGAWAATAHLVLAVQVVIVLSNLNPLFPTDGYHAVEAALGGLNYRRRAFGYALNRLFRRPLPTALVSVGGARRVGYVIYTTVALVYMTFVIAVVVTAVPMLLTGGRL
jgi:putative peptide zinc metalloprotease protein